MNLIICVDEKLGVSFNRRRLSQDRVLRKWILDKTAHAILWMNSYSAKLFSDTSRIHISECFLNNAHLGDYCYVELLPEDFTLNKFEKVILCKWNRHYPADQYLEFDETEWRLEHTEEFPGSSHEKLTVEVYSK